MADIFPFRGIRYNIDKIGDLAKVATPPYDVISEEEQDMYYERHPNNVIRLDKGKPSANDDSQDNPYTRATEYFKNWLAEGILVEDESPCFYLTSVEFNINGQTFTRYGLIARVRLEPFENGVILPHEETYSKIKSERLELMKACHANFSHIFSIYTDKDNIMGRLKSAVSETPAEAEFTDDARHHHKMWRITDAKLQASVTDNLKERRLFIADGHHRYETALTYRDWLAEQDPNFGPDHPANFIMMYLCSIEDPGLIILPTHRLLTKVSAAERNTFVQKSEQYFTVNRFAFENDRQDEEKARGQMLAEMKSDPDKHIIGGYIKGYEEFYTFTLKPDVMKQKFEAEIPEPLRELDVTVLTRIVLTELLEFDHKDLDDETLISYTSNAAEAIEAVDNGDAEMAFILNPPSNEQVRQIAEAGYTMPRKTTFYYPKAVTGQVMNSLTE
ncbi:MAG TPA: DUF1015 domain-containing protein [Desulfosalsimonadaceae bacterium]|nr:DUF1015 domain-containing protein [Desulfosalsimonadaceae bacterium]